VSSSSTPHCIVTGGAGFIGSHVVDALIERGRRVWVVDDLSGGQEQRLHPQAELIRTDVTDHAELLRVAEHVGPVATWYHLAAQIDVRISVDEPIVDATVNVLGTLAVLEAARTSGAQVVFASTGGAIYGEAETPTPEGADERPISFYGAAKLAAEKYVATHARLYGLPHAILRYANVYGPRQDPHGEGGVVAIFGRKALADERPIVYGDGLQTRDYVFVGDVVAATIAAGEQAASTSATAQEATLHNVGTGVETNVLELWAAVQELTGCNAEPEFRELRAGEVLRSALDASRARAELDIPAPTPLHEGLAATIEWLRAGTSR
jgi:UDP-glucose 4-epimerase